MLPSHRVPSFQGWISNLVLSASFLTRAKLDAAFANILAEFPFLEVLKLRHPWQSRPVDATIEFDELEEVCARHARLKMSDLVVHGKEEVSTGRAELLG